MKCPFCGKLNPRVHAIYTVSVYGIYNHNTLKIDRPSLEIDELRNLHFECCDKAVNKSEQSNSYDDKSIPDLTLVEPEREVGLL